jgi:hypothetical protein
VTAVTERATHAQVEAQLEAWRERGADRLDPLRFRLIEALAQRAASHGGEARRLLDTRLSELMSAYAALDGHEAHDGQQVPTARKRTPGALGQLVDQLGTQTCSASGQPVRGGKPLNVSPELIDYFRATWARVRAGQQLREAQVQVPQNAGPLNSNSLVHRSLSLMRELSPGYLQQFLAYADALSWLEQLSPADTAASKETPRATGAKKSTRARAR